MIQKPKSSQRFSGSRMQVWSAGERGRYLAGSPVVGAVMLRPTVREGEEQKTPASASPKSTKTSSQKKRRKKSKKSRRRAQTKKKNAIARSMTRIENPIQFICVKKPNLDEPSRIVSLLSVLRFVTQVTSRGQPLHSR